MNKLIVFDLDGTLIDSIGGIANSVNRTRSHYGFEPLDEALIASYTGDGIRKLLERSCADITLPVPADEAEKVMLDFYKSDPVHHTYLYPGVAETLAVLKSSGYFLAVLSNKPQAVSDRIIEALGIAEVIDINIGGGAGFRLKPDPEALEYLMDKFQVSAENTWMVGDNHTDIGTAVNAGTHSIFCRYGMGIKGEYQADIEIDLFAQLPDRLAARQAEIY